MTPKTHQDRLRMTFHCLFIDHLNVWIKNDNLPKFPGFFGRAVVNQIKKPVTQMMLPSKFLTSNSSTNFYRPQGRVMFSQVSVCPQLASWILVHCSALLQHGRYASYWNAFLLISFLAFLATITY